MLTPPAHLATEHRGERPEGGGESGVILPEVAPGLRRGSGSQVPAHLERSRVAGGVVQVQVPIPVLAIATRLAEGRDRRDDEPRVQIGELLVAQSELVESAGHAILDEDIRALE